MRSVDEVRKRVGHRPAGSFIRTSTIPVDVSVHTMTRSLDRLADEGMLLALERGLWFKPHPDGGGPKLLDFAAQILADLGVTDGFGPAGISAAEHLGLAPQSSTSLVAVSGHHLSPVAGVKFVHRTSKRTGMTMKDVAVLEMLRSWPILPDLSWKAFTAHVVELHAFGDVNVKRVVKGAKSERANVVRERADILARAVENA